MAQWYLFYDLDIEKLWSKQLLLFRQQTQKDQTKDLGFY